MQPKISSVVRALIPDIIRCRRFFHRHPEPGFKEFKTAAFIRQELKRIGIPCRTVAAPGIAALLKVKGAKKTLLVRADMDALPVQETARVAFRSQHRGFMHACGHDAHMAMALGAAKALTRLKDRLACNVKFMFQPAEEGPGGAQPMIRAGILKNPKVDAALALHVWSDLPSGVIGIRRRDASFAAAQRFDLTITGPGGHGAAPHLCADSILAAAEFVTSVQSVVSRRVNPLKPAVVTVGSLHAGSRSNIIPGRADLRGTIRALDDTTLGQLRREIARVLAGIDRLHGTRHTIEFSEFYPAVINDPVFSALVADAALGVVGRRQVIEDPSSLGAEDMAFVLREVPGCYARLGIRDARQKTDVPHHSGGFKVDERVLPVGAELIVQTALQYR
ncbi:MAG: amidohydrolase [Elusimicrobiota bacterium]